MVQREERADAEFATPSSAVDGYPAKLVDMGSRPEQVLRPPRTGSRGPVDGPIGRYSQRLRG